MYHDDPIYPEHNENTLTPEQVWQKRFQSPNYLFGKEPSHWIKTLSSHFKKGAVLDLACAEGRHSVYLAKLGFNVEGIDFSEHAISKANFLAKEAGVTVQFKKQSLDFFLMPLMKYDSIVMTYYKPLTRMFSEIKRGLVAGGTFYFEACLKSNTKQTFHEGYDPAYSFKPNEALQMLAKDFQVIYYNELAPFDGITSVVGLFKKP